MSSLQILHFNDVYNIDNAPQFATVVKQLRHGRPGTSPSLVLFSGDALNPSTLSTSTKGKHMVDVLNGLGIACACVGNHDLDFGLDVFRKRAAECNFPWLLANVLDKATGKPLGDAVPTTVIQHHGWKVGVIGLAEKAWLATLATLTEDDVTYTDFCVAAKKTAADMRASGCDIVIALTHMRRPQDERLAREADVDLVLGGHDHDYSVLPTAHTLIAKSGTDFRELSEIVVTKKTATMVGAGPSPGTVMCETPTLHVTCTQHLVGDDTAPDADMEAIVEKWSAAFKVSMARVVGKSLVGLEARFQDIRTKETNVSNLVADLARQSVNADVAIINAGTLRADCVMPPGDLTLGNLVALLPMPDPIVSVSIPGTALLAALENALSQHPSLEGRFPCVSGMKVVWDPDQEPESRVVSVSVDGLGPLEAERRYSMATKAYLLNGKDGFTMLSGLPVLVDDECGPVLPTLLRNHLRKFNVLNRLKNAAPKQPKDAAKKVAARLKAAMKECGSVSTCCWKHKAAATTQYVLAPVVDNRLESKHTAGRLPLVDTLTPRPAAPVVAGGGDGAGKEATAAVPADAGFWGSGLLWGGAAVLTAVVVVGVWVRRR